MYTIYLLCSIVSLLFADQSSASPHLCLCLCCCLPVTDGAGDLLDDFVLAATEQGPEAEGMEDGGQGQESEGGSGADSEYESEASSLAGSEEPGG